jgi:hypothetical protein
VFNWDGSGLVVKESFKYYWAIAIPVTVLVLLVWGLSVCLPWKEWLPRGLVREQDREERGGDLDFVFVPLGLNTVGSELRRNGENIIGVP